MTDTLQAPIPDVGDDVSDVDVPLGDDDNTSDSSSIPKHSSSKDAKAFQSVPDIQIPDSSKSNNVAAGGAAASSGEAETSTREQVGRPSAGPSPSSTSIASSAVESEPDSHFAIQELMNGATLQKYGRWGKAHLRHFTLSADKTRLCWESDKKKADKCVVVLSEVSELLLGRQTKVFKRFSKEKERSEHLSFSLVYGDKGRTLDLQCRNKDQLVMWLKALRQLTGLQGTP